MTRLSRISLHQHSRRQASTDDGSAGAARVGCYWLAALTATCVGIVQAQPIPADPGGIYRLRAPQWPAPPPASFELRIETPERSPIPRAVDELRFEVKRVVVEGASLYPADSIDRVFADLVGSRVGLSEIRDAAEQLERRYREDGYFLVRVLIPAQRISDGTIRIQVVEGRISALFAQGGDARLRERVEQLTEPLLKQKPLDLASLESAILRLNDWPGVEGQAVLRPGTELGQSELIVNLAPSAEPRMNLEINNHSSRPLGEYGINLSGTYANPFDRTGALDLGINTSADAQKLRAFSGRYATPVGSQGSIFSLGTLIANARPAGSLRELGVVSDSRSVAPQFRIPLTRSRGLSVFAEVGLTFNDAVTTLNDLQLSQDRYAAFDRTLVLTDGRRWEGSTELRIGHSAGLKLRHFEAPAGSQPSVANAPGDFHKLVIAAKRTQDLGAEHSLIVTARAQLTNKPLLTGEKMAFGGQQLGRAYDGGAIAGDRGWGALAELRWTPPRDTVRPYFDGQMQLYGFSDYARTQDTGLTEEGLAYPVSRLQSLGLGVRFLHRSGLNADLQLARALIQVSSSDPRPDPRLSFSIAQSF